MGNDSARLSTSAEALVTTEDALEHMSGTLELIAGHECTVRPTARIHADGNASVEDVHQVRGDRSLSRSRFAPDTCPVCMAEKCLAQIDEALSREGGLL